MTPRILIVGTDQSYCSQIKEFFQLRDHNTTIVNNYKDGFERLFFDTPHITVIEFTSEVISASFLNRIKESPKLQLVDSRDYQIREGLNPVFILQEYNDIKSLYDNIDKALNSIDFEKLGSHSDESGDLDKIFLPRLLKQIEEEQRTGLLVLESVFRTEIFFNTGMPIYCRGSSIETGLGRILLREKKITPEQYDEVVKEIGETKGQKIGETLVFKGYISPHELNKYLELQIKEKIVNAFVLNKGKYSFKYNVGIPEGIYPFKFRVDDIIYDAVMRYLDTTEIENLKPVISPKNQLVTKAQSMNLGPKELRVVQMLGKNQSIDDIFLNAGMDKVKVLKFLYFLALNELVIIEGILIDKIGKESFAGIQKFTDVSTDEILSDNSDDEDLLVLDENSIIEEESESEDLQEEIKEEEAEAPQLNDDLTSQQPAEDEDELELDTAIPDNSEKAEAEEDRKQKLIDEINEFYENLGVDYYQLLQVDENAENNDIKNSYLKLVKKFHPDKIINFPQDTAEKAEEIFSSITVAYETLTDKEKRSDYDSRSELDELKGKASNIFEAEVRFSEGEVLLRHRNYSEAENKFREAIYLNPDESAYIVAHSWARFNSSDDKQAISQEIIGKIEKAISKDPDYAKNYYYLGSVYKMLDNLHKAEKNFEKAVEIDKTLIEAKRELRLLVNRRKERKSEKDDALKGKGLEKRFWSGLFKK